MVPQQVEYVGYGYCLVLCCGFLAKASVPSCMSMKGYHVSACWASQ
jgi:hypothetical protein